MTVPIGTPVTSAISRSPSSCSSRSTIVSRSDAGERLDQLVETPQIGSAFEQHPGIVRSRRDSVAELLIGFERNDFRRPVALKPAIAGAPHDLKQPALGIAVAIAVEIAKRAEESRLHDIGGIGIVAR